LSSSQSANSLIDVVGRFVTTFLAARAVIMNERRQVPGIKHVIRLYRRGLIQKDAHQAFEADFEETAKRISGLIAALDRKPSK
jgi:hypothetical protein